MGVTADPDEADLAARLRAGDPEAFRRLFERHRDLLARRVRSALPAAVARRLSASDVLQEVGIVALRRAEAFEWRGPGSVGAWLLGIADHKVREMVRRHAGTAKRDVARERSRHPDAPSREPAARQPSPSEAAVGAETAALLRAALDALPPEQREVVLLVRERGLSLRDAAERLGKSHEAVKKAYGRGILRLQRRMERGGGTPRG